MALLGKWGHATLDSFDSWDKVAIIAEKLKSIAGRKLCSTLRLTRVQVFLDKFEATLAAGGLDAAVAMFAPEC